MGDNLRLYGKNFPNASGIKAKDINGNILEFIRPAGTLNIENNGLVDVTQYANVNVIIGGGGAHNLPYDYVEVIKIVGPAGAYIDTGVQPNETTSAVFKVMPLNVSGNSILGTSGANDSSDWRIFNYNSEIYWDVVNKRTYGSTFAINEVKELKVENNKVTNVATGEVVLEGTEVSSFTIPYNIYINGGSNTTSNTNSKWYYVQIYQGSTKVRDFIPCYRRFDNVVGMYDLVNDQFYYSAGSEHFALDDEPAPTGDMQEKTVSITPTESAQTQNVTADSGYDGLSKVTINTGAISSTYVGSGITQRSSTDLTASGATVSVPAGYYSSAASKAVSNGTEGTPTASKGTVSNHSIAVTPSVTNTAGYISGSTKTGTAVTVSASEVVSGTKSISANGTGIDVTNYASVDVAVPSGSPNLQSKSASPTESQQTIEADSGYDGLSSVTVGAISTTYVGSGIARKSSTDLTASGATVTAPAGYYAEAASKSVASGSATTPATTVTVTPGISVSSGGLITATASGTKSVTPTVSAGYVSSGTAGTITVSGSNTSQLTTLGATTYYTSGSDQTITSGKYITGTQTIKAVTTTNLTAANIKKDVVVQVGDSSDSDRIISVTGTYEGEGGGGADYDITVSTSNPTGGKNGDIWVHQVNITETLIPSDYTGLSNMTVSTSYPVTNSYSDTNSTSYTQWTFGTSVTGLVYYTFDASSIPAGATVTGVTAKAKVRVSNTGRITNTQCQLYVGSTAKGSNVTFASTSTSNVVTLSVGSGWSRSDLNDVRMKIGGTSSTSSSTKAIYYYGGEITVTYIGAVVYKKVSGSWQEYPDMLTIFESGKSYRRVS